MTITQLPGFSHPVHDVQMTFRALMNALARPGKHQSISPELALPEGINLSCAAACLTLLDLETQVWLQANTSEMIKNWLVFHTGCRLTTDLSKADFALILDSSKLSELSCFYPGTDEEPQTSTTLFLQINSLTGGEPVKLTGPGILGEIHISPIVPENFWNEWRKNHLTYPLGVDILLMAETEVIGLPRTVKAEE